MEGIFPALGLQKPEEVPHITPVDLLFSRRVVLSELEDSHAIAKYYESAGTKEVQVSKVESYLGGALPPVLFRTV